MNFLSWLAFLARCVGPDLEGSGAIEKSRSLPFASILDKNVTTKYRHVVILLRWLQKITTQILDVKRKYTVRALSHPRKHGRRARVHCSVCILRSGPAWSSPHILVFAQNIKKNSIRDHLMQQSSNLDKLTVSMLLPKTILDWYPKILYDLKKRIISLINPFLYY